jgi:hypothetical protein
MRYLVIALELLAASTLLAPTASAQGLGVLGFNQTADSNTLTTPGTPHSVVVLPGGSVVVPPALAPATAPEARGYSVIPQGAVLPGQEAAAAASDSQ